MRVIVMILLAGVALATSGCLSHRGNAFDNYDTTTGTATGNPASPTVRPGMNSDDIRDPNALTRPLQAPPASPP